VSELTSFVFPIIEAVTSAAAVVPASLREISDFLDIYEDVLIISQEGFRAVFSVILVAVFVLIIGRGPYRGVYNIFLFERDLPA
jgi:hypothetical protein